MKEKTQKDLLEDVQKAFGCRQKDTKKMSQLFRDAREHCVCRLNKVLWATVVYYSLIEEYELSQDTVADFFTTTTASLRSCAHELKRKGLI